MGGPSGLISIHTMLKAGSLVSTPSEVGRKTNCTPTREVINCTCWRRRESAAKDKRDWVQCDRCKCWSHLSCYRIAQNVIAKEDVQFYCFSA